jgi:hypothetical protein
VPNNHFRFVLLTQAVSEANLRLWMLVPNSCDQRAADAAHTSHPTAHNPYFGSELAWDTYLVPHAGPVLVCQIFPLYKELLSPPPSCPFFCGLPAALHPCCACPLQSHLPRSLTHNPPGLFIQELAWPTHLIPHAEPVLVCQLIPLCQFFLIRIRIHHPVYTPPGRVSPSLCPLQPDPSHPLAQS